MIDSSSTHKLAIVIPAYKGDFLAKTLACLLQQTDQRFSIYIGDDASPADIQGIARSAFGARSYVYKRFENNLGGVSLAKHWNRCVGLANEPWIWLFSDDDLMDANCVEVFHKFLESEEEMVDIVRFDCWIVDESDRVTEPQAFDVDQESWLGFAYGWLKGWRQTVMQKLLFRRRAFEETGGFLDLPMGWATDNALIISLGRQKKIRQLRGARVFWRNSMQNITPSRELRFRKEKLRATCIFLHWLHNQLQSPRELLFEGDDEAFRIAMDRLLIGEIMNHGSVAAIANWNLISRTRIQLCNGSRLALLKFIAAAAVGDSICAFGKLSKVLAGFSKK
jgi:glycosyltransferase involved in cell wall biosynthesis